MNSTLSPKASENIQQRIEEATIRAKSLSLQGKKELAAIAWNEVEELLAEASNKEAKIKSNFEQYCDSNPWAGECRIYDV